MAEVLLFAAFHVAILLLFSRYQYGKNGLFMPDFAVIVLLFLVEVILYRLLVFQSLSLKQRDAVSQVLLPSFWLLYFQVGKNRLTWGMVISVISGALIVGLSLIR